MIIAIKDVAIQNTGLIKAIHHYWMEKMTE
jgi:hypothetical protein